MNKAFYIVGIVFGFIFMCVTSYFMAEVSVARSMEFISSMNSYSDPYSTYSSYSSAYSGLAEDATSTAAMVSIFFFLLFITVDLLGLMKVKTKVNKVFAIIGLSLSGIMLLWNFLVLADPGAISFDEVGGAFIFYSLVVIAFSIVGLVQSIRFSRGPQQHTQLEKDLLDS
jgi:hypothetical protein